MDTLDIVLLYDYYGDLLTDRQKECFEMRYYQDLSLGEIAAELGISRQGVHDNLSRTEAQLQRMEEKTGCVRRDMQCRLAARQVQKAARQLSAYDDKAVADLAQQILNAVAGLEE